MLKDKPATRVLLTAIGLGLLAGVGAVFHLTKATPGALGFFAFTGVLIGDGLNARRRR